MLRRFVKASFTRAGASAGGNGGATSLPADMLALTTRRLILTAWVFIGAYAVYWGLYNTAWREYSTLVGQVCALAVLIVSPLMILYLRRGDHPQRRVANIAIAYELFVCAMITTSEFCDLPPLDRPVGLISWSCVVIVWFPLVVPASPGRVLLGSLAAATMTPISLFGTIWLTDLSMPPAEVVGSLLLPPYLSAVIAYAPARVLSRLRSEVSRARQLGSYELVEELGHGGMGEVWRARHRYLARPAAVKLIRPEALGASDSDGSRKIHERFEREAQTTASLRSPHTVELYDFGVSEDGIFYYVMELLDGDNLEQLVKEHGPLPPARAIHVLVQVCDSLGEAHDRGLVHRDIKPANIIMTPARGRMRDFVQVLDFGLVKGDPRGDGAPLTVSAVDGKAAAEIKGTPAYLAPEMVTGKGAVDSRADLYAVGCVAVWLLAGEFAFDAQSAMEMAIAHVGEEPRRLADRGVDLPTALDDVVMDCLAKDPADRPASAAELADRLAAIDAGSWTDDDAAAWWQDHGHGGGPASPAPTLANQSTLMEAGR